VFLESHGISVWRASLQLNLGLIYGRTGYPTVEGQPVHLYLRGGGQETHSGWNGTTRKYAFNATSRAQVVKVSDNPVLYERRLPGGGVDVYGQPNGALSYPRKVFLTRSIDAQGQAVDLTYDQDLRLVAITDAIGQVTTLSYELASDPLKITRVSDPFGRSASFLYDPAGRLARITDAAKLIHWLHTDSLSTTAGVIENEKEPLETMRTFYKYPGMTTQSVGTHVTPSGVGRQMEDGTSQIWSYEYNARGRTTKAIDPLGRETVYVYGTNNVPDANPTTGEGMDLLQVKQKNGGSYDVLTSYTYNGAHQPLTITDARGAVTTYTYNAAGQVLTATTPPAQGHSQGPTTTFTYDTNGYLQGVAGPVPGATTSFTYDGYGRKRTSTDAAGLVLTYDYDALDRVTKVTYPDTTYEQTQYKWLDVEARRDRLGRRTQTFYDALRRPLASRDAALQTTLYEYGAAACAACSGGGDRLTKLTDANGHATGWDYDVQGRVTRETRADGHYESYTYDPTSSRLAQKTDRKGVTTSFEYFLDGRLKRKSYSDTTPAVNYTYDPADGLMLTAANGTDTLTWTYDNLDRVATEASTRNASTVGYTYDDAGNRVTLSLDAALHLTYGYDAQSRLTSITRGTSVFGFGYDIASRRSSMTYPNGVVTTYGYDGESRLTSLAAARNGTSITSFTYVLDAVGNRTRKTTLDWAEDYGYDATYRLVSADRSSGTPSRWRFAYDAVGNRTADQTGDASNGAVFNSLNQLLSRAPGGALAFRGTTNEPASVTIAGQPAQTTSANTFSAQTPVASGNTDVAVTATDPSGNARTNTYRVSESGATASYTYDPNGNLTTKTEGSDTWTYEWNARNDLTRVLKNGVEQARLSYDPLGRRVEKLAGGVTSTYTYDAEDILREARGSSAFKYVHGPGIDEPLAADDGGALTYLHSDGLWSIMRTTSAAGAVGVTRQYDAWGNAEAGATEAGYAFTGREWDMESRLYYYRARYYDSTNGRFITEDPIGLLGGVNLYVYVGNKPVTAIDPSGLEAFVCQRPLHGLPRHTPFPLVHEWLCVVQDGKVTCGGQTPSGSGSGSPGKPTTDDYWSPNSCRPVKSDSCMDECLKRKINSKDRPYYRWYWSNCQTWTTEQYSDCFNECLSREPWRR
jgi:RHS repeat-associated protein